MIAIRGLVTVVITFLTTAVMFAEPAVVKSGEHGTFSRLVISADFLGMWKSHKFANTYRIEFSSFNHGFDIDDVFTRIGRGRIQSIDAQSSYLELGIACLCDIKIFEAGPNMLVIDVKDEPYAPIIPLAMHSVKLEQLGTADRLSFPNELIFPKNPTYMTFADLRYSKIAPASLKVQKLAIRKIRENMASPTKEILVGNLQAQLIGGFGAASTRGILDLDRVLSDGQVGTLVSPLTGLIPLNASNDLAANFSIISSLEKSAVRDHIPHTENFGPGCNFDRHFDISNWSDGQSFSQQLGDTNANLFNALDKLDIGESVKLARLYLFFGFGAEAKQVLELDAKLQHRWPELSAIADILEDIPIEPKSIFAKKNRCKGSPILWATISGDNEFSSITENLDSILLELSSLPINLRRILAPKVSSRFLKGGRPDFAKSALNTLARTEYASDEVADFEKGVVLLAIDRPAQALEVFSTIKSNSYVTAEALIQKALLQLETDLEIDKSTMDLIEGYRTEYRDTPIGLKLQEVAILALSRAGQFTTALGETANLNVIQRPPILQKIYSDIVKFADDAAFAKHSFTDVDKAMLGDSPNLPFQFAIRLFTLGFYYEADKFLERTSGKISPDRSKLLGAKISIALGKPAAAAAYLDGVQDKDAKLLQAQVSTIQENHDKAAEIYRELGNVEQEWLNSWLSSGWQKTFNNSESPAGQLAQITLSPVTQVTQDDGMLKRVEDLLAESRQSRNVIANIFMGPELNLQ